jgi:ABC-type polysaccharide/polyol phosphate export permease
VALSLLGSFTFAGLGLLVASRATNTQTVGGLINLVTIPMFILSGVFFSSARFPDVMQPFIRILPLTALNDALRAVMLDGAGVMQLGTPLLILTAWGIASFAVALRIFRWR